MAEYTKNYNLKKPGTEEFYNIADFNDNADIIDTTLENKVDKITGKGLSTNDYTTTEKNKLANIETGANKYIHPNTHPSSIITETTEKRFVSNTEMDSKVNRAGDTMTGSLTAPSVIVNIPQPEEAALPDSYPIGITTSQIGTSTTGWPTQWGSIITYHTSNRCVQIYTSTSPIIGQTWIRARTSGTPNTWGSWQEMGTPSGAQAKVDTHENKAAPHSGHVKTSDVIGTGQNSIALGQNATAEGGVSIALGGGATAEGDSSIALGGGATATGYHSTALGRGANATGNYSTALGRFATATEYHSTALGTGASAGTSNQGVLGVPVNESGPFNWIVPGTFAVTGTKTFEIPHPKPEKKETHTLRHCSVESPTAGDTLYRWKISATKSDDVIIIDLPDYFVYLNKDVQIFVTPQGHYGAGYGDYNEQEENIKITCQNAGEYNVLVIGTRKDDAISMWDQKGVEKLKDEQWFEVAPESNEEL